MTKKHTILYTRYVLDNTRLYTRQYLTTLDCRGVEGILIADDTAPILETSLKVTRTRGRIPVVVGDAPLRFPRGNCGRGTHRLRLVALCPPRCCDSPRILPKPPGVAPRRRRKPSTPKNRGS